MQRFVTEAIGEHLHDKRILSLSKATTGVIHSASLGVSALGRALALSQGTHAKRGIKQVDRLLSNSGIDLAEVFAAWVPFVLSGRSEARIALDWTHFDADGHATIAAYLITNHGRATPLVWRTFPLVELTDGGRTDAEDLLLLRLREVVPEGVRVTLLADRGFGDAGLYAMCERWGWDYVVRFRTGILVTSAAGETKPVEEWLSPKGHAKAMRGASVTAAKYPVGAVVTVRAKGMKDAWYLEHGPARVVRPVRLEARCGRRVERASHGARPCGARTGCASRRSRVVAARPARIGGRAPALRRGSARERARASSGPGSRGFA